MSSAAIHYHLALLYKVGICQRLERLDEKADPLRSTLFGGSTNTDTSKNTQK